MTKYQATLAFKRKSDVLDEEQESSSTEKPVQLVLSVERLDPVIERNRQTQNLQDPVLKFLLNKIVQDKWPKACLDYIDQVGAEQIGADLHELIEVNPVLSAILEQGLLHGVDALLALPPISTDKARIYCAFGVTTGQTTAVFKYTGQTYTLKRRQYQHKTHISGTQGGMFYDAARQANVTTHFRVLVDYTRQQASKPLLILHETFFALKTQTVNLRVLKKYLAPGIRILTPLIGVNDRNPLSDSNVKILTDADGTVTNAVSINSVIAQRERHAENNAINDLRRGPKDETERKVLVYCINCPPDDPCKVVDDAPQYSKFGGLYLFKTFICRKACGRRTTFRPVDKRPCIGNAYPPKSEEAVALSIAGSAVQQAKYHGWQSLPQDPVQEAEDENIDEKNEEPGEDESGDPEDDEFGGPEDDGFDGQEDDGFGDPEDDGFDGPEDDVLL